MLLLISCGLCGDNGKALGPTCVEVQPLTAHVEESGNFVLNMTSFSFVIELLSTRNPFLDPTCGEVISITTAVLGAPMGRFAEAFPFTGKETSRLQGEGRVNGAIRIR